MYLNTYPKVKERKKGVWNLGDKLFGIGLNEIDGSNGSGAEGDTNDFILQQNKIVRRNCQLNCGIEVAPLRQYFEKTLGQTDKPLTHA